MQQAIILLLLQLIATITEDVVATCAHKINDPVHFDLFSNLDEELSEINSAL